MSTDHDPRFDRIRRVGGAEYAAYVAAGYRELLADSDDDHHAPYLLRKMIREGGVSRYFINAWVYDPFGLMPVVQFNTLRRTQPTFNVVFIGRDKSPAVVEAFFATVYERMACEPYEELPRS